MYCRNCGSNLGEYAQYCPNCGAPTEERRNDPRHNESNETNVLALVGFILSFFIAIAGLICSIIGYKKAAEYGGNSKSFALAGIIISAVSIAFSIISLIWILPTYFSMIENFVF